MNKSNKDSTGGGAAYFQNTKNTEISELQADLNSMKIELQKEAMKQIIASMTVGKDVSPLFPHVVKCMTSTNVELKKLIYLYIINYAKSKPDTTLLAVNAFHKDATNKHSPLIRALAVRTMGCIRVHSIVTYLCETLKITLKDDDPYVRKTSCICVAKLYSTCPGLVKESGLIESVSNLLLDGNAVVVSNAIVSINEISTLSGENLLQIKSKTIKRILSALNEANEWGQVFILDALINYTPKKDNYAEDIIESVIPRLSHENPAVVMSAVKVILKFLDKIENVDNAKIYCKKISNCLMTVIRSSPEIQYCLLRSLHAVIQKRPFLLDKDFKYFYIIYNDPIYIKLEKIDILYRLTDNKNFESIINELKNYALMEFDVELVKKAVRYIGYISYKFEKSVSVSIECLKEILDHNMEYAIGEALVVARDLMRKYKGKTLDLLKKINSDLIKQAVEPEPKCAVLYMLGEFSDKIKNSTSLITEFAENFSEEVDSVKLQVLNAVIKNFVVKPSECQDLVKDIIEKGAQETENPDVRDRAYIYWRLLEIDVDMAKDMILAEKPSFDYNEDTQIDNNIVDDIINNMTNISAIYHDASSNFILKEDMVIDPESESINNNTNSNDNNNNNNEDDKKEKIKKKPKITENRINQNDQDLIGLDVDNTNNNNTAELNANIMNNFNIDNIFGMDNTNNNVNTNNNNNNNNNNVMSGFEGLDFGLGSYNNTNNNNNNYSNNTNNDNAFEFDFPSNDNNNSYTTYDDTVNNLSIFNDFSFATINPITLVHSANTKGKSENKGVSIFSNFGKQDSSENYTLGIAIKNSTNNTLNDFKISLNLNCFSLTEDNNTINALSNFKVNPNEVNSIILPLSTSSNKDNGQSPYPGYTIDVALKCSYEEYTFKVPLLANSLFTFKGKIATQEAFKKFFSETKNNKVNYSFSNIISSITNEATLRKVLEGNNIFFVCKNSNANPVKYYFSCSVLDKYHIVYECSFNKEINNKLDVGVLSINSSLNPLSKEVLSLILTGNE